MKLAFILLLASLVQLSHEMQMKLKAQEKGQGQFQDNVQDKVKQKLQEEVKETITAKAQQMMQVELKEKIHVKKKDNPECASEKIQCTVMLTFSDASCISPVDLIVANICRSGYQQTKALCRNLNKKCSWGYTY